MMLSCFAVQATDIQVVRIVVAWREVLLTDDSGSFYIDEKCFFPVCVTKGQRLGAAVSVRLDA